MPTWRTKLRPFYMSINNHWRNKQLGENLLKQEQICLEFLLAHQHLSWHWLGTKGYFYQYCQANLSTEPPHQGLIWINHAFRISPKNLVQAIDRVMTDSITAAYISINRFEIVPINDLDLVYPDCIEKSLDLIVDSCRKKFRRLYNPNQVDGKHFVGVHGLDVFVYETNH